MKIQKPTMGRIVIYVDHSGNLFPAVVIGQQGKTPDSVLINPLGECRFPNFRTVAYSASKKPYTWHYPERCDETIEVPDDG